MPFSINCGLSPFRAFGLGQDVGDMISGLPAITKEEAPHGSRYMRGFRWNSLI